MAYLLEGERPAAAGFSRRIVSFVAGYVATVRMRRAERRDLRDMLRLKDHQLEDLGLTRHDLMAAFDAVPTRRDPFDIDE